MNSLLRGRVAVVDDDPSVRRGLKRLLEAEGHEVAVYGSAEEFESRPAAEEFRVVVLDIHLPGISGIELAKRLAERWDPPRVVLMTGHAADDAAMVAPAGVPFLLKPFPASMLMEAVHRALSPPPI